MADLMTLRYFGPERHADWCSADPAHEGFCLDLLLAKVVSSPASRDGESTPESSRNGPVSAVGRDVAGSGPANGKASG